MLKYSVPALVGILLAVIVIAVFSVWTGVTVDPILAPLAAP